MAYDSRNLDAEKQALSELMSSGQYKLNNGKNQDLQTAINQKAYGSSQPVFKDNYGLTELEKKIQDSTKSYNQMATGSQDYANMYEGALKNQSPEFLGATREKLMNKYKDANSPDYVENALDRNDIVNQQVSQGSMTLGELLNRAMGVYGARASQREANVNDLQSQYQNALAKYQGDMQSSQAADESLAQAKQQAFENDMAMKNYELALMELQGKTGSGGGGGGNSSGGAEGAGIDPEVRDMMKKAQNREISREDFGKWIISTGRNRDVDGSRQTYDQVMNEVYTTIIPDQVLRGTDVGGQILEGKQLENYQRVQNRDFETNRKQGVLNNLPFKYNDFLKGGGGGGGGSF